MTDADRECLKRIEQNVVALRVEVNGNEQSPGIKGRVTRLETLDETRRWHFRTLWAVIVGVVINGIVGIFGANK